MSKYGLQVVEHPGQPLAVSGGSEPLGRGWIVAASGFGNATKNIFPREESAAIKRIDVHPAATGTDLPRLVTFHRGEEVTAEVIDGRSMIGGGSLPDQTMPTWVVHVEAEHVSDAELAYRLRTGAPAVVGRVKNQKLVLDVRTILPGQEETLAAAVAKACTA